LSDGLVIPAIRKLRRAELNVVTARSVCSYRHI
jgi:hypothetical protein